MIFTPVHSTPLLEYCHNVWREKLEWCGYPMTKEFDVYTFRQNTGV